MIDPNKPMRKVDARLWAALRRLEQGRPDALRNARNAELMAVGRLEISITSVCREAPASRNTVLDKPERFEDLVDAINLAEAARRREERASREAERQTTTRQKRALRDLQRTVVAQASIIGAQMVEIHRLNRRIESMLRASGKVRPDAQLPLGGRRHRSRSAAGKTDQAASQGSR